MAKDATLAREFIQKPADSPLTPRDHFAAEAMKTFADMCPRPINHDQLSRLCYAQADSMLRVRTEPPKAQEPLRVRAS